VKLFQTIVIFDVVVAGKDDADARDTLLKEIRGFLEAKGAAPFLEPTTHTACEIRNERDLRAQMRDKPPIVGEALTDAEYQTLKGKTNLDVFNALYTKTPKEKK